MSLLHVFLVQTYFSVTPYSTTALLSTYFWKVIILHCMCNVILCCTFSLRCSTVQLWVSKRESIKHLWCNGCNYLRIYWGEVSCFLGKFWIKVVGRLLSFLCEEMAPLNPNTKIALQCVLYFVLSSQFLVCRVVLFPGVPTFPSQLV